MSESTINGGYRRVAIRGVLELTSDLHLGSGETESYLLPAKAGKPAEFSNYNSIALDNDGRPYIPGSSLRGLLRSLAGENTDHWFGTARGEGADQGDMGRVRVYDAQLEDNTGSEACCMSRTAIDPVTGTAQQHQLATHERVKAGARFRVEIELDTRPVAGDLIAAEEVETLLTALQALKGAQLGGGKSVGQGEVQWVGEPVAEGLLAEHFSVWLENCLGGREDSIPEAMPHLSGYFHATGLRVNGDADTADSAAWTTETIYLSTQSPLLINNPHDIELEDETTGAPKLVFHKRSETEAVIPGSTLKGWFRARCRKILLTLNQGAREKTVDAMLDQLFGSTEQASLIRFYDACADFSKADEHIQTFIAVDRFTGGVKEGALYTVKALWLPEDKVFSGRVSYRKTDISGWMQLLLLFAWRDAEEGDLVLGWGKAKGYGRLMMKTEGGGTEQWIDKCQDRLPAWEAELTAELNKEVVHG